jgi:hypothetical protein
MILQLGGLAGLIIGIVAAEESKEVKQDDKQGKIDFWYQRRKSKVSTTE